MNDPDNWYNCDTCGKHTPDGSGHYTATGRHCRSCVMGALWASVKQYSPTGTPVTTIANGVWGKSPETKPCMEAAAPVKATGFNCFICNSRNDYAEANYCNNTQYICYECRGTGRGL